MLPANGCIRWAEGTSAGRGIAPATGNETGGTIVSDIFSWPLGPLPTLAALAFGYLLGSIPFGLILTRMAGLGDVRKIGSGNIGATNVLRTGNKKLAAATLLLDALKGTAAAAIASRWGIEAGIAAGFAAFLGHLFPVWLGFKGGKGVATYVGVLLGLVPVMLAVFAAVWITCAYITRYSSLSALVATAVSPVVLWFLGYEKVALLFLVLTLITWWKHSANISRLVSGTESKIGSKG
ncbi:glycerol-3-phosphate acyltransferase [Shinella sumterensis]|nr:glycerol-3-phosphate 1-O-acyltransferase PlsY [Shinella sumterensis]TFE96828.1 glycerol-3-phosphate acyltransferase [Shinella sumterensis]